MRLLIAVEPRFVEQFVAEEQIDRLARRFAEISRVDTASLTAPAWRELLGTFRPDALMSCWGTPAILEAALPRLRYVAHLCGGVRQLVTRQMLERGLWVTNWGDIHAAPVAEHALLLILSALRQTTRWTLDLHRDHRWPHEGLHQARTLFGRRVAIHGFGLVARNLVNLLKPFGCPITAYSAGVPDEVYLQHGVRNAGSLEALFDGADVLVEVEALTPATRHSVTEPLLRRLPSDGVFVNVGRGAVVDEAALIRIAREGQLHIGLDVFESEPLKADSPFLGLANVTLTPHIGGPTVDLRRQCGQRAVANLERFAQGEVPQGLITPEIYDRST